MNSKSKTDFSFFSFSLHKKKHRNGNKIIIIFKTNEKTLLLLIVSAVLSEINHLFHRSKK